MSAREQPRTHAVPAPPELVAAALARSVRHANLDSMRTALRPDYFKDGRVWSVRVSSRKATRKEMKEAER